MSEIVLDKKVELIKYDDEDVLNESIEYFKGDKLAAEIWIKKYALKDSSGNIYERTPEDMHKRIASELARVEKNFPNPLSEEKIFEVLKDFKYIIPQGSPMSGIGNNFQYVSLSNCFVIGNLGEGDSYGGIMKIDQEQVQLMKRRGGVGHDLSHIRPRNSEVMNSALTSTGVVPFMERYSNSTREVAQEGRRGALMLSISINHPDAEDFIDAKMTQGKVTGANVSVRITDDFMNSLKNDTPFIQKYPVDSDSPKVSIEVDSKKLWNKIVHNAWKSAEPGILFWDNIINESLPDCYSDLGFKTTSTNPCGEIPLCPDDSCRLFAINLYSYVENPFTDEAYFNYELFEEHVGIAQRLMDDLIELELEKINSIIGKIESDPENDAIKRTELELWKRIKNKCEQGRRTGLGITAEGDMIAALNLQYASVEGNKFAEDVHKRLKHYAYASSCQMAKERGPFLIWDAKKELKNPFLLRIKSENPKLYNDLVTNGRRNIALLTIAPTGTTSMMTQTTSGIEPVFLPVYRRRRKINPTDKNARVDFTDEVGDTWQEYSVFHHKFETYLKIKGYDVDKVKDMSEEDIANIVKKSPYHNATSNDVDWVSKVEMQGMIQKHIDHSISVTVNLPNEISEEMVSKVYMKGWESGCKGITVYRDGSRSGVLISSKEKEEVKEQLFKDNNAPKRPKRIEGEIIRFQNNHEKWVGVIGTIDGRPYELFTGKLDGLPPIPNYVNVCEIVKQYNDDGSSRYDLEYTDKDGYKVIIGGLSRSFDPEYWNYAKMISGVLRHGMPLIYVVDLVSSLSLEDDTLMTWKNGVVRVLKKYIPDGTKGKNKCPNCSQEALIFQEGCLTCSSCGHAKCG